MNVSESAATVGEPTSSQPLKNLPISTRTKKKIKKKLLIQRMKSNQLATKSDALFQQQVKKVSRALIKGKSEINNQFYDQNHFEDENAIVAHEQLIEFEDVGGGLRSERLYSDQKLHSPMKYTEDPYRVEFDAD